MAQSLMVHVHIVHLVCAGRKVISKRYANANNVNQELKYFIET